MISVQRLDDLMVPRFFWLLLLLHASLNSMYGVPVSTFRAETKRRQRCHDDDDDGQANDRDTDESVKQ